MISSRRITHLTGNISTLKTLSENKSAMVYRNGQAFVFIKKLKEAYEYGPVDDMGKPLLMESIILKEAELNVLVKFLELNKEHNIEIIME